MQDNNNSNDDTQGLQQSAEKTILTQDAKQALQIVIDQVPEEYKTGLDGPTMNKIHRAVAGIPMDKLRLMMADGQITGQEARMALAQEGLSPEEIEQALEYTRQVLLGYARKSIPPEKSLTGIGELLNEKVRKMGEYLKTGKMMPAIKKQSKGEMLTASTAGQKKKEPEGKTLT